MMVEGATISVSKFNDPCTTLKTLFYTKLILQNILIYVHQNPIIWEMRFHNNAHSK